MTNSTKKSRVLTLVFTDLADSTALKTAGVDDAAGDLIARHRNDPRFKDLLRRMNFPKR